MKRFLRASLVLITALCAALSTTAGAQPDVAGGQGPQKIGTARLDRNSDLAAAYAARIQRSVRSGQVNVMLELDAPPAVQTFSAIQKAGAGQQAALLQTQRQVAALDRAQQALLPQIARANATVLYRAQRVYNGIAVRVDVGQLDQLSRLPGVKAIHQLVAKYPDHSASVPLIGAPDVWSGVGGFTGSGIEIAVLDTGVDYVHKMFGGSGDYTGVTDTSAFVPTAKVTRGFDFVGDAYNGYNTPVPDSNPMDCNGHGSHVAGTAAGFGVLDNGTTYTGPWNNTIYGTNNFRIAPGVAPEATIAALRVFGCDGSSFIVDQAIEWAVDPNNDGDISDRVDVINMSLGSDYGSDYDTTSVAADNAIAAGVIVVASAGNSSDSNYIVGSPSTAEGVISVAAVNQADAILDAVNVNAPAAIDGPQPASFSVAYPWETSPNVTGAVYYPATNRAACAAYSPAEAASIAGKIVLVDWTDGECGSVGRTANVAAAGGIGAILIDNGELFDLFITGSEVIPAVSMPKSTGDLLKANLAGLNITFSNTYRNSTLYQNPAANDVAADFTSRGAGRNGLLKPDIAAPGVNIFSTATGTGDEGTSINGTSMAAPHVAGGMALLLQAHPDWTVQELKALAMNSATKDVRIGAAADSQVLGPARVGAGRINLTNAATLSLLAYDSARPGAVGVSFGNVEVVQATTLTRTVTVVNKGTGPASYDVAYTPVTTIPGVSYSVTPASVTLAGGAETTLNVVMTADPSKMRHTIDPTMGTDQGGFPRFWISDASGYLSFYNGSIVTNGVTPNPDAYSANIRGYYENPPTGSAARATATATFVGPNTLNYSITFAEPINLTAAHIHRGAAGLNGQVVHPIAGASGSVTVLNGSWTGITPADLLLLAKGEMYFNFHTAAFPNGEVRGQIVPTNPTLRLPVHASARPASDMTARLVLGTTLAPTGTLTGTIELDGFGVNNTGLPTDTLSIASLFELAASDAPLASTNILTDYADLQYVGVTSDLEHTGVVSESILLFAVTTHDSWSSPNQTYFEIQFDTDEDGTTDYALFTTNSGVNEDNDDIYTSLVVLDDDGNAIDFIDQYPINVFGSDQADTQPFNTNALVLAVDAGDLGLNDTSSDFNYQVLASTNVEDISIDDQTGVLHYNVARPGIRFGHGLFDLPFFNDLPATDIAITYNPLDALGNGTQGILVIHHHNTAWEHVEVLGPASVALPLIVDP